MTRDAWNDVAKALADLRVKLLKREQVLRVQGVDLAARVTCAAISLRSKRFNGRTFMRIVRGAAD